MRHVCLLAIQLFDGVGHRCHFDVAESLNQRVAWSLRHGPNGEPQDGEECSIDPSVHFQILSAATVSSLRSGADPPVRAQSIKTRARRDLTVELKVRGTVLASYRSEEHTSELQSLRHLVCRLL